MFMSGRVAPAHTDATNDSHINTRSTGEECENTLFGLVSTCWSQKDVVRTIRILMFPFPVDNHDGIHLSHPGQCNFVLELRNIFVRYGPSDKHETTSSSDDYGHVWRFMPIGIQFTSTKKQGGS